MIDAAYENWLSEEAKKEVAELRQELTQRSNYSQQLVDTQKALGRAVSVAQFYTTGKGLPDCSTCTDRICDESPCDDVEIALEVMSNEAVAVANDPTGQHSAADWLKLLAEHTRYKRALEQIKLKREKNTDTPYPCDDQAWWIASEALKKDSK